MVGIEIIDCLKGDFGNCTFFHMKLWIDLWVSFRLFRDNGIG